MIDFDIIVRLEIPVSNGIDLLFFVVAMAVTNGNFITVANLIKFRLNSPPLSQLKSL